MSDQKTNGGELLLHRCDKCGLDRWFAHVKAFLNKNFRLVDYVLGEAKMMKDETEARAYHLEFLFRSIRRKITGLDKK